MSHVTSAVVDAWAALALMRREGTAEVVMRRYVKRAHTGNLQLLMNVINLGEVYYRLMQLVGPDMAADGLHRFRRLPIEILPARETLVMNAARLKAQFRMSYADAFAVASAQAVKGAIITGDPEILALPREVVKVVPLHR